MLTKTYFDIAKDLTIQELISDYEYYMNTEKSIKVKTQITMDFLSYYVKGFYLVGLRERGMSDASISHFYTRFASVFTNWIISDGLILDDAVVQKLFTYRVFIVRMFAASGYYGMSHLINFMGERSDHGHVASLPIHKATLLMLVLGLDEIPDNLLSLLLTQDTQKSFPIALSLLAQRLVLTQQGERNRTRLLQFVAQLDDYIISPHQLELLFRVWMYTSYADYPNKHDAKASLNKMIIRLFKQSGIKAGYHHSKPSKHKKPRLLIIHERFTANHAMYRCYAPIILSLKTYFHTISFAHIDEIDHNASSLFDEFITIDAKKTPFAQMVDRVKKTQPDLIYYPSVGMAGWVIGLANLRLAKVQLATQGHPATTRSSEIDYIYLPEMEGDLTKIYSEKLLIGSDDISLEKHSELDHFEPQTAPDDGKIHIAVNSKVMKLSYRLIDICKKLNAQATKPLHFHFFPGERGIEYDGIVALFRAHIPNSTTYYTLKYPAFLQKISQCHISLAAFPFGNTNSTVDTCLLGIPTVAHFGPEAPAQSDKLVLSKAKAPLYLVNHTDEAYFQTALSLINDASFRQQTAEKINPEEMRKNLFCTAELASNNSFAKLIHYAYRHHAQLMASPERVFRYSEIFGQEGKDD